MGTCFVHLSRWRNCNLCLDIFSSCGCYHGVCHARSCNDFLTSRSFLAEWLVRVYVESMCSPSSHPAGMRRWCASLPLLTVLWCVQVAYFYDAEVGNFYYGQVISATLLLKLLCHSGIVLRALGSLRLAHMSICPYA